MLNRPLVLPLAALYLALQGWMLLMALLEQTVPPVTAEIMRVLAWAGMIDGLYWLATSPWGAGPPPPEGESKTTLSKILSPLALRAEAIARPDARTWGLLFLRLFMVCGVALVVTRFVVMAVVVVLVILALFQLLEIRWVAIAILWCLFMAFLTHLAFVPLASLIVLAVPLLILWLRPEPKAMGHAMVALGCAGLGLLWELQSFETPPTLIAFLKHILQTGTNLQAMLPGLFLGAAASTVVAAADPN